LLDSIKTNNWATRKNGATAMTKFILGFVAGLIVATVGFSGVARIMDSGVQTIQKSAEELAR
jgi:hypothetical protein